jgi:hypothetical protein
LWSRVNSCEELCRTVYEMCLKFTCIFIFNWCFYSLDFRCALLIFMFLTCKRSDEVTYRFQGPIEPFRCSEQSSLDVSYIGLAACNYLEVGFDLIANSVEICSLSYLPLLSLHVHKFLMFYRTHETNFYNIISNVLYYKLIKTHGLWCKSTYWASTLLIMYWCGMY